MTATETVERPCQVVDPADPDVALCCEPVRDEPWCVAPCQHEPCPECAAALFDEAH